MEPARLGVIAPGPIIGLVVDSSVPINAERGKIAAPDVVRNLRQAAGDVPIVICALTIAELGHGVYHARTEEKARDRC
jgi:predicted nucleic acid-binding protein